MIFVFSLNYVSQVTTTEIQLVFKVEPGTCFQRLMGSVKTGVILKDVSLEVHGGEVLAILGSKGDDITMCTDQLQYYIYNFSFLIHEL